MSTTIDERVVEMRFDNNQFESNVKTTLSTLSKLKDSLNFKGASKGLEDVQKASEKCDMSILSRSVDEIKYRFSGLEVMAVTALANITNSAVNAGKKIVSAFTLDPIKTGFQEYETQINAVQTILANTSSKGTTLDQVNSALDELNRYADMTIYNFTQMTRNIGTFTAAGIDLKTSVSAIKGIANLAAVSGSTSQQASTAMYQLSQALASGTVKLMDWNSVVNAGMGGQVFQDALKETARVHGIKIDEMIKKEGSFRETLKNGWLTSSILTETLAKFTGDLTEEQLKAIGYTDEQIAGIIKMGKTANDAATKVKTFTQLMDTLKEAAQSGWTQSWEIIIGDFEEAKDFLTKISDTLSDILNDTAASRNKILSEGLSSGWKQLLEQGISDSAGYKDEIIKVYKEYGTDLNEMIKKNEEAGMSSSAAFEKAVRDSKISSDILEKALDNLTNKTKGLSDKQLEEMGYTRQQINDLEEFNKAVKDGSIDLDEFSKKLQMASGRENLIKALENSFDALLAVLKPVKEAFREIFPPYTGEQLYSLTEKIKDFTSHLFLTEEMTENLKRTFKGLFSILDIFKKVLDTIAKVVGKLIGSEGAGGLLNLILKITGGIGDLFTGLNNALKFNGLSGALTGIADLISKFFKAISEGFSDFTGTTASIGKAIGGFISGITEGIAKALNWISQNVTINDILKGILGGATILTATKLSGMFDKIKDVFSGGLSSILFGLKDGENIVTKLRDLKDSLKGIFDSLAESLNAFTTTVRVGSILAIAASIAILSSSLEKISGLSVENIGKSLIAIGLMMTVLTTGFSALTKALSKFQSKGIVKASFSMILLAEAINILTDALIKISSLSLVELVKGLIGLSGGLLILTSSFNTISKVKVPISSTISIVILAKACENLGEALKIFGSMSWGEIARGLVAMGGALIALVFSVGVLQQISGFKNIIGSISLFIIIENLSKLANSLKIFGSMSWDEIDRGLSAMQRAMAGFALTLGVLGKLGGFSSIFASMSISVLMENLKPLAESLSMFGFMSWGEIARGLVAMGGAIAELAITLGFLGKLAGFSSIISSISLSIIINSLDTLAKSLSLFGSMSWDEIIRGLVSMGGALIELSTVIGVLGKFGGLSSIIGSTAILIIIQGLNDLATALKTFGSMSWDEIDRGLSGMGGALLEVSAISGGLGAIAGFAAILGGTAIWIAVQGLNDLATALKTFGSMSWDEVERGLSAMGLALAELAMGSFLNTLGILGAGVIVKIAEPIGVLADSIKKWNDVTVPPYLGLQLSTLAQGVRSFTFDGLGANAISTLASPIGTLAESIKKWRDVTVPSDINENLSMLAQGVRSFTFDGLGANAISKIGEPLGYLADSVKKWANVAIPPNLNTQLSSLSDGVKSFTWAFMGGWSINEVGEPLGILADSVKKWNGVTIPEGLNTQLSSLSEGVKSFTWAFVGGFSIKKTAEPLGVLADSIRKWNGIIIPEGLGENLGYFGDAVGTFAEKIKSLNKVDDEEILLFTQSIDSLTSSIGKANSTQVGNIDAFIQAAQKLGSINIDTSLLSTSSSNVSSSINGFMDSITNAISNGKDSITSSMQGTLSGLTGVITGYSSRVSEATNSLINAMTSTISSKSESTNNAFKSLVSNASSGIRASYQDFVSSGKYLGSGLIVGINAMKSSVYNAGFSLGQQAVKGERDGQQSKSPSKATIKSGKWLGEGLVIGMSSMAKRVYNAGTSMGQNAANSISDAVSRISDFVNSNVNTQPIISPVLDLTNIKSGTGVINGLFNNGIDLGVSTNINAISSSMNSRSRNSGNFEIISAINNLRKDLGNLEKPSYNINGITYDDGSNISNAIETIVRAATIERRI